jgi:hypothetical protein
MNKLVESWVQREMDKMDWQAEGYRLMAEGSILWNMNYRIIGANLWVKGYNLLSEGLRDSKL